MSRTFQALSLAVILVSTLGHAGATLAATGHEHGHSEGAQALQLDAGKRWATDAPLRQAMGIINDDMRQALPAIHENRLPAASYGELAEVVRSQAAYMVENCELSADADAQLHLIIAQLLSGADAMSSEASAQRDGAVTVVGALDNYATYFVDDGFKPLEH
ncbi:hypothetical protein [Stutzerimonas xanthomarina]|uniref:hypothetical protein n=1 Tax=Stutzerimonas xanthomarina TaxID=271420 RepID=UPI003AA7F3EC